MTTNLALESEALRLSGEVEDGVWWARLDDVTVVWTR